MTIDERKAARERCDWLIKRGYGSYAGDFLKALDALDAAEAEIAELRRKCDCRKDQLVELIEESQERSSQLEQLETDVTTAAEMMERANDIIADLRRQLAEAQAEVERMKPVVDAAEAFAVAASSSPMQAVGGILYESVNAYITARDGAGKGAKR